MQFQSIIPILYSADIDRSIRYYLDILGFDDSWKYDNPPTFGGISRGEVRIYFCRECQGSPGTWLAINLDNIDAYYEEITRRGAIVVNPPETMEWGMREMLVKDPDGHLIRFGQPVSLRTKSDEHLPAEVHFLDRAPTTDELKELVKMVGWPGGDEKAPPEIPQSSFAYCVIAMEEKTKVVVGCAFLLTDHAGFYYVKNVIVHPAWQGKQVGNGLMQHISDWLDKNAPDKSMAYLHTGENLAPFYRKFGFIPGFSMMKRVRRK